MKSIKTLLILLFVTCSVFGQNDTEDVTDTDKKTSELLPQAGDIAIGIEAAPFLQYFGNMFNGVTTNDSPDLIFLNGTTIFAKYFLEDDVAIRARLGVTMDNEVFRSYVTDELAVFQDPLSRDVIVDRRTFSNHMYLIGLDYEMRRGYNRLQGYYGGGINFSFFKTSNTYEYGNAISSITPDPASTNFGTGNLTPAGRVLETGGNMNYAGGINGFVGIEYFLLPKISIGGEMGLAMFYTYLARSKEVIEFWDGQQAVEQTTMTEPGDRYLNAFTVNPSLGIYIMFHF